MFLTIGVCMCLCTRIRVFSNAIKSAHVSVEAIYNLNSDQLKTFGCSVSLIDTLLFADTSRSNRKQTMFQHLTLPSSDSRSNPQTMAYPFVFVSLVSLASHYGPLGSASFFTVHFSQTGHRWTSAVLLRVYRDGTLHTTLWVK